MTQSGMLRTLRRLGITVNEKELMKVPKKDCINLKKELIFKRKHSDEQTYIRNIIKFATDELRMAIHALENDFHETILEEIETYYNLSFRAFGSTKLFIRCFCHS